MTDSLWLEATAELAARSGEIALSHFRRGIGVERKQDGSPVTAADRAAEEFAREWIMQRFPDHGIVGEEYGTHLPTARWRWLIDPIDGTRTFIAGVPLWGTLVALCDGNSVIAGAASYPAIHESLCAAIGQGAWAGGSRCSVSNVSSLGSATVLTTDERFRAAPKRRDGWNRLADAAGTSRSWGDCYGYLLVASGRAEAMVDGHMGPWDAAPFLPIIAEAGGVFVDYKGNATPFGDGSIATNAALAPAVHSLLGVGT
jgi:Archaeal fructose-1,6-bisphosphatase and related enzymes of inositol monophosphatase family